MNPHIPHYKVLCASIISKSEVSIKVLCLLRMFTLLHSSTKQELFEKYVCNQSSHNKKYDGAAHPSYPLKLKYTLPFSVSCIQLVTQQYESRTV